MTRDLRQEMIRLLTIVAQGVGSQEEQDAAAAELLRLSPDPEILDYVFHPAEGTTDDVTAAVDRALACRAIRL